MKHLSNLIALSLLLAGNAAMAQEVSIDEAKSNALEFLSSKTAGTRRAKGQLVAQDLSLAYTSKSEAKTCFYVFNVGNDEGFVIAGGDESARQILGYCDHGSFDYETANPTFKWWLGQYTEQIAHAEEANEPISPGNVKAASTDRVYVAPMIQTKWNQNYPYNSEIPVYDSQDRRYLTGCVATAMAQIMNYHQCPAENGSGSHYYVIDGNEFFADFEKTDYDWENMAISYTSTDNFTEEQARAVGTLMYHAGVSLEMHYGVGESGALSQLVPFALAKYFKYDKSVKFEYASRYSIDEWEELIYNELKEGRPVLYSAANHAFVCDGYDNENNMFSFNWGWGGDQDGFGSISASRYLSRGTIVRNIMPDQGYKESINLTAGFKLLLKRNYNRCDDNTHLTYNLLDQHDSWNLECTLMNYSCISKTFDFGVEAKEITTGKTFIMYSGLEKLKEGISGNYIGANNVSLSFDPYEIKEEGTYELRPVVKGLSDEDWTDIYIESSITIPSLTIDIEPTDIMFTSEVLTIPLLRTIQIEHSNQYLGKITYTSSNPDVATVDETGLVSGVSEGTVTITAHGDGDAFFNETSTSFEITVTAFEKFDRAFSVSNYNVLVGENLPIIWNNNFEGEVIFSSSDPSIATVDENGLITGISPGYVIITAQGRADDYYNDSDKSFDICVQSQSIRFAKIPYFTNENIIVPYIGQNNLFFEVENVGSTNSTFDIYYTVSDTQITGKIDGFLIDAGKKVIIPVYNPFYFMYYDLPCRTYTMNFYKDDKHTIPYNYPSINFTACDGLYVDYSVSPAGYGTLILPFNAELPEGMTIYSCPSVDENGVLTLVEEGSIERNKPYIVKATYGENYHFEGPEVIDDDKPSFQEGILVGAVADKVLLRRNIDYILQVQNDVAAFYKYTGTNADEPSENDSNGNRLAKQFRAFLRLPEGSSNAPKFNLPGFDEDETEGISTLRSDGTMPAGIYSIDGKRQSEFQKGLNILLFEDGTAQKVFVK
jgi:hypothetical protein